MAKRKPKPIEDTKPENVVEVTVETDAADVEWFDTHLLIPVMAFSTMAVFLWYMHPAVYTQAYWQWLFDNTPHYGWHDLMPLDNWSDFWKVYK